jgi:hypothetical protein
MMRLARLSAPLLVLLLQPFVADADGVTPARSSLQGRCYAGSSGLTAPCIANGITRQQVLRTSDDAILSALWVSGSVTAHPLTNTGTGSTGDVSGMRVRVADGSTVRIEVDHTADQLSLFDFGAKCDGTTDDSAAVAAAAGAKRSSVPGTTVTSCRTGYSLTSLPGPFTGPGRIVTSDGTKRGPLFTTLQAYPSALGDFNRAPLAFNGDLRGVGIAHEHVVTGASTLGQPSSGYLQFPESSAEVLSVYNNSGWNSSTSGNGGRTGTAGKYYRINHLGQGDLVAIQCSGFVGSTLRGATSFLANPAIECLSGDLYAGANGQYLEFLGDMNLNDNGFDVAASGLVLNMRRTNAAEGLGALWMGARFQNQGTQPVDVIISATGKASIGLDFSGLDLSVYSLAQINLGSGGSGYVVGDVLTMSGGTYTVPATVKVTAVSAGSITGFSVVNAGLYSVAPATRTRTSWLGGSGKGATFYAAFSNGSALILPPSGCVKGSPTAATFPNAMVRGTMNTLCFQPGGISIGNGGMISSAAGSGVVQMGTSNMSTGTSSIQLGQQSYDDAQKNALLFSSGWFTDTAGYGSSQIGWRIMRGSTSSSSAVRLTTDQSGADSQNSYLVAPSSLSSFEIVCNAIDTVNGDFASWKAFNGVANRSGSGNVSYQGDASTAKTPDYSSGAGLSTTIAISADTSTQALNLTFTPSTSNTHWWHAQCAARSLKIM